MASAALRGVAKIKGLVNSEKKYTDKSLSIQPIAWTGQVDLLSSIAQGNDDNQRQGNSVLARSLYLQMDARINTVNDSNVLRVLVVVDTENTGTAPTVSDVLQTSMVGTSNVINAPINNDHLPRYNILLDKKLVLSKNGNERICFKRYIKLYKHIKYTGANATDTYKNNIYMVMVSDVGIDDPFFSYYSRLGFMDN